MKKSSQQASRSVQDTLAYFTTYHKQVIKDYDAIHCTIYGICSIIPTFSEMTYTLYYICIDCDSIDKQIQL